MRTKSENLKKLSVEFNIPRILNKNEVEENKFYAVRSDDLSEDEGKFLNSGKFLTLLNVPGHNIEQAIKKVKKESDGYFIQEMLNPDFSFVILKTNRGYAITINNGDCEGITSGKITGVNYIFNSDKIEQKKFGEQEFLFRSGNIYKDNISKYNAVHIENILGITDKVSEYLHFENLCIEGSFQNNDFIILQAKQVTT